MMKESLTLCVCLRQNGRLSLLISCSSISSKTVPSGAYPPKYIFGDHEGQAHFWVDSLREELHKPIGSHSRRLHLGPPHVSLTCGPLARHSKYPPRYPNQWVEQ